MQVFPLQFRSNQTFQFTPDMTAWFAAYPDFADAVVRARIADAATFPPVAGVRASALVSFSSVAAEQPQGTAILDPVAKTLCLAAPESAFAALSGLYVYDCAMTLGGATIVMFGGTLQVDPGVT